MNRVFVWLLQRIKVFISMSLPPFLSFLSLINGWIKCQWSQFPGWSLVNDSLLVHVRINAVVLTGTSSEVHECFTCSNSQYCLLLYCILRLSSMAFSHKVCLLIFLRLIKTVWLSVDQLDPVAGGLDLQTWKSSLNAVASCQGFLNDVVSCWRLLSEILRQGFVVPIALCFTIWTGSSFSSYVLIHFTCPWGRIPRLVDHVSISWSHTPTTFPCLTLVFASPILLILLRSKLFRRSFLMNLKRFGVISWKYNNADPSGGWQDGGTNCLSLEWVWCGPCS